MNIRRIIDLSYWFEDSRTTNWKLYIWHDRMGLYETIDILGMNEKSKSIQDIV